MNNSSPVHVPKEKRTHWLNTFCDIFNVCLHMTLFKQRISVQWDKDSIPFLDFSTAFVTLFLSTLLGTTFSMQLDKYTAWWANKWPGSKGCSKWWDISGPVTSGIPQGSMVGSALFSSFIKDPNAWHKSIINKFANDTKLEGAVDCLESREALQRSWQTRGLGSYPLNEVQKAIQSPLRGKNPHTVLFIVTNVWN